MAQVVEKQTLDTSFVDPSVVELLERHIPDESDLQAQIITEIVDRKIGPNHELQRLYAGRRAIEESEKPELIALRPTLQEPCLDDHI
jgi:hypothetical protein